MITSLRLRNFRCFDDHTVELNGKTLLVGRNNAGKSTCVEALRIVSVVTERIGNLVWKDPPPDADIPTRSKGVRPSLESIAIHRDCLFHRYGVPPALISTAFANGSRLDVHVGSEFVVHAVAYAPNGRPVRTREAALAAGIPRVSILPQIGPLSDAEGSLSEDHVRRNFQTTLSSLHFRNQLRLLKEEYFDAFQRLASDTWPGLSVESLEVPQPMDREGRLGLFVRDGDFSAEVAWMGHGLQMWLQTMWFLVRSQRSSVPILDEPDVYMHADLQRRLVRMLTQDHRQFIIATHSPEMLAEVEAESVVVLDRCRKVSRSASSSQAVQQLLVHVGSVHNLSLARLAVQRRILFVEGEDVSLLKRFQNVLDPKSSHPIDTIPNTDINGWTGWPAVLVLARFFKENTSGEIRVFCVLDRDFHTDEEVEKRIQQAKAASVRLHIWSAKELENYVLVPAVIARVLTKLTQSEVREDQVEAEMLRIVESRKDETFDSFSEAVRQLAPRAGADKSNATARPIFNARWKALGGRYVVGGKQLFSEIATWAQSAFKVSISIPVLVREMQPAEVPLEVAELLGELSSDDHAIS